MNGSTEALRLENEAGELLTRGAEPWRVLRLLIPLPGAPRTRAAWLRSEGWLRVARREGPSGHAEQWLRYAFESGLADLARFPSLYDQRERAGEDAVVWLSVAQPFAPWFEYLVMFGRFDEARAVRARAVDILGPGLVAKPRPRIKALIEVLVSMATPDIFSRALQADFIPRLAAAADCELSELRMSRIEGPLEILFLALPVPVMSREPLWFAFARAAGDANNVRIFTMDWHADEYAARPAAWARTDLYSPRLYGSSVAPGAAPRPNLGADSPYLPPFLAFIGEQMTRPAPLTGPTSGSWPPIDPLLAPVPTLAPRSVPAPPPKRTNVVVPALVASLLMLLAAAFALLRATHH